MGWLPHPATELFGEEATAEEAYDLLTVDVPPSAWLSALETARDTLGCTYFDWLSAVDEPGVGFRVSAHVVALRTAGVEAGAAEAGSAAPRRLLVRTTVPHEAPALPTAIGVYAGAAWHERETHEMFGVDFTGHPHLVPLLLPDTFEGHPLRKDFVLAARVAKAWPGAKEPGESEHGGPKRRQMLPPGVPDPNEWGPLKGQLPPAPARPARGARAAGGERPPRRTRTAGAGSASQAAGEGGGAPEAAPMAERPARRTRSAGEGSASQSGQQAVKPQPAESAAPTGEPAGKEPDTAGTDGTPRAAEERGGAPEQAAEATDAEKPTARESSAADEKPGAEKPGADTAAAETAGEEKPGADTAAADKPGADKPAAEKPGAARRSSDAPWHHARPAFDDTDDTGDAVNTGGTTAPDTAKPGAQDGSADEGSAEPARGDGAPAAAEEKPPARENDTRTPPPTDDDGGETA
ncbi:NADH-quinone oxidoreductase subunit C [Streptomyces sp. NPDC047108]|uniref:NADH-quinone oxidoreductase subunit C n=1 Tax=Streptomyces sp. NPDC047108 TaxID=3155025 RepID=UPI00340C12CC